MDDIEESFPEKVYEFEERPIASYFKLSSNYSEKQVMFFEGDIPKLRRFDSLPISAQVTIAYLDGNIYNMDSLYNYLACFPQVMCYDDSIPEGTPTSVRWKDRTKGESIGFFPHSIAIIMWNGKKKITCKIFKKRKKNTRDGVSCDKLQIAGADTVTAKHVAQLIARQLQQATQFYDYITANPADFADTIYGLEFISRGEPHEEENYFIQNTSQIYRINWPDPRFLPDKYQSLAAGVIQRCTDLRYTDEIVDRGKEMLHGDKPCSNDISLNSIKRAMSRYNYNLGFRINRLEFVKYLVEVGYAACFFNEVMKYVFVPVADEIVDLHSVVRRDLGRDNQFEFYESGKVKHSGTGSKPMEQTYICIMFDIIRGIDRFGILPSRKY